MSVLDRVRDFIAGDERVPSIIERVREHEQESTAAFYVGLERDRQAIADKVKAEPPFVIDPLPPYDHDAPCPKCRFAAGMTEYWAGSHRPCSVPGAPLGSTVIMGTASLEYALRDQRRAAAVPEHLERWCPNCKHTWAEAVLENRGEPSG